jgi:hypothetical protein
MASKKLSASMTIFLSVVLLSIASMVMVMFAPVVEELFYGAQGGEMVQLQTSHVPTLSDLDAMKEERKQVQRDLIQMTGSY